MGDGDRSDQELLRAVQWRERGVVRMSELRRSLAQGDDMKAGEGLVLPIEFDAQWCAAFLDISQDFNEKLHGPGGVVQGVAYPVVIGAVVSLVLPNAKPRDLPIRISKEVQIGSTIVVRIACLGHRPGRQLEVWTVHLSVNMLDDGKKVVNPVNISVFRKVES